MILEKYSMGIGDRFGQQGSAQLRSLIKAKKAGVDITPVWNKSFREHEIVGTAPEAVRTEADAAVKALGWTAAYFVDADHIGMKTVEAFVDASDFFTLDVADVTGRAADPDSIRKFVEACTPYTGSLKFSGVDASFPVDHDFLQYVAEKYLLAIQEAGRIYRYILSAKGNDRFITEVSMDETDAPQSPAELFFILAAIAREGIPVQTIAPKFIGRFNKGVDYVGNVSEFETSFVQHLAAIETATQEFELPGNLKLSVHTGSDKFSIYPLMGRALQRMDAGIHLKTAGTTWLEELIGLAEAGGEGLSMAKSVYRIAFGQLDELQAPYTAVIDIDPAALPEPDDAERWDGKTFAETLRHEPLCRSYNLHFRQLLHIGFKVAANMGDGFLDVLKANENIIARHVCENLFERHIKRLFMV
jgi:tagaturonate epimerase